jgi:XisH protein
MTQKVRLPMFALQSGAKIAQIDDIVDVSTKGKFMPAFDVCHPKVVRALENDGWIIIAENVHYRLNKRSIFIDLRAERLNNGNSDHILLAEVKCFAEKENWTTDLYGAIGQYLIYQEMLRQLTVTSPLFLAIPETIYDTVFDKIVRQVCLQQQVKIIVVDLEKESITQWLK